MNALELILSFIAEIVMAVAWPLVVLFLIYVFRDELPELVRLIDVLKFKDFELRMKQNLQELPAYIAEAEVDSNQITRFDASAIESRFRKSLDVSPRLAIMDAWTEVELTLCDTAVKAKIFEKENKTFPLYQMLHRLEKAGIIRKSQKSLIWRMRELRNSVVHVPTVNLSDDDGSTYIEAALSLIISLRDKIDDALH